MFIDRGRIVFNSGMEEFESRYAEVTVNPERLAEARALRPMSERTGFGRSVLLFDGVERARLAEMGEVRTPSIADVFVAVVGRRSEGAAGGGGMSAQTNAVSEPRYGAERCGAEDAENAAGVLVVAARALGELVVVGSAAGGGGAGGAGHDDRRVSRQGHAAVAGSARSSRCVIEQQCEMVGLLIMLLTFLVTVFYCLDALYGERRDRSVLFWRSLPVSDTVAVMTKAGIAIVMLPLLTFVVALVTQWMVVAIDAATLAAHGRAA